MVTVSDFDGTLFVRNKGLVQHTVDYLEDKDEVVILTFRREDQAAFIQETLAPTNIHVVAIVCTGDRKKQASTKMEALFMLRRRFNINEIVDNQEDVLQAAGLLGIKTTHPDDLRYM